MEEHTPFPESFLWGAATSAYQIEGSPLADGAGASTWHRFVHTPGLVHNGETGDVACDHYLRFEEDVRLMHRLGLCAYRFSIAWGRILPEGQGRINEAGLAFYDRLVDTLLAHDIQPLVTLYHWDLPAALDDRGGWLNRDIAGWFADYAQIVFHALDDRVPRWITLNEPWVVTDGGYLHGVHAPGHHNLFETPRAAHNLLRAHAAAVQAYRAEGAHEIGITVNLEPKHPASDHPDDQAAAERADAYMNRQYLDPIFFGTYPDALPDLFGPAWPDLPVSDLDAIRQPIDFLGINYYTRGVTEHDPSTLVTQARTVKQPQHTYTAMDWEVYPEGLTDVLEWVHNRYGPLPLYVTENGAAFYDPPTVKGDHLDDPLRVQYLRDHLRAAHTAIQRGIPLRGYFAWSLLDNFEWSLGYSRRFGLVHVDFETQQRTPKASAHVYAEVIRTNGASLFTDAESPPVASPQSSQL